MKTGPSTVELTDHLLRGSVVPPRTGTSKGGDGIFLLVRDEVFTSV